MEIAIIGSGVSGILAAIRLKQEGYSRVRIYEKAQSLGGTWRENTYPGLTCDVPSHSYCYSFALKADWSHLMAPQREILSYLTHIAEEYSVSDFISYEHELEHCLYQDGCWGLRFTNGKEINADLVIAATGVLHQPKNPEINGLESFNGDCFHSARWDHDVETSGRKIGVIGSGSTAVQIACALVEQSTRFSLFQRTPQWIFPLENRLYSEERINQFRLDEESLRRHYQDVTRACMENFADAVVDANSPAVKALAETCLANLEENVKDPELRELLRPDYQAACKRLVISDGFYEAIQHENARLVTSGISRIEPEGVRTDDGELHELDVLVLATGFCVDAFVRPMKVVGKEGQALDEVWSDGPHAYMSMSVPGFPNFFFLNGPNGPVGNISLYQVAELQMEYLLKLIKEMSERKAVAVSATAEAEARFNTQRREAVKQTIWSTGCDSWYLDESGVPTVWPWKFERFKTEMKQPRFEDYFFFDAPGAMAG